jgi:hypothetical protein
MGDRGDAEAQSALKNPNNATKPTHDFALPVRPTRQFSFSQTFTGTPKSSQLRIIQRSSKVPSHTGQVSASSPLQPLKALLSKDGNHPPPIRVNPSPRHEPTLLQPINQPRDARPGQQHRISQLSHP